MKGKSMKQLILQIHDSFADKIIIGAVGQNGENITTCTILIDEDNHYNRYKIGADGRLRFCGIEKQEVPR